MDLLFDVVQIVLYTAMALLILGSWIEFIYNAFNSGR